ncbi:MAG: lipopolysaccharide assembly protein LapA domain-containing protein [Limnobacter sp.]|nr:lipopolysaccharide assembly protein LapA domain-containing protein [Limnobacter sp.]
MKVLIWFLRVALFLVILSFTVRNTDPVVVRWLPGLQAELPLVLALLFAFLLGLVLAWLILLPSWLKARRGSSKANKALAKVQKERSAQATPKQSETSNPALTVGPTHGI